MRIHATLASIMLLAVVSLATAAEIELVSGEHLQGTITAHTSDTLTLDHPILGKLNIPLDKIKTIEGKKPAVFFAPTQSPEEIERKDSEAKESNANEESKATNSESSAKQAIAPEKPEREWKGSFNLSGSFNSGTSDNSSLFLQFNLNRDNKVETTRISSFYRFASNNNETIQSWYNLTADQVWKLPELDTKWDIYADLQFDWSEENSWQQRIAAHFGGQYPLLTIRKSEENPIWFDSLVLNGRVGVGPRKEFSGLNTDVVAEGDFGGNLTWHIADGHSVTANGSYMPDLEDFNQYRIDATLNWKIALKSFEGLSLEVGVKYQFQSEVQSDDKNYDLLATVGLTYDF